VARTVRHHRTQKRGADVQHLSLSDVEVGHDDPVTMRLTLRHALEVLRRRRPRPGRVVDCRLYRGLSVEETARTLNISPATVKRDWQTACTWLRAYLTLPPNKKSGRPPRGTGRFFACDTCLSDASSFVKRPS
jgi:DNA-directed RNA polymerase specialized sigma24 family protein